MARSITDKLTIGDILRIASSGEPENDEYRLETYFDFSTGDFLEGIEEELLAEDIVPEDSVIAVGKELVATFDEHDTVLNQLQTARHCLRQIGRRMLDISDTFHFELLHRLVQDRLDNP